jgi:hypothetical protein
MSFEVDGVPYEERDQAILALVEEYICDMGDSDTDAVGRALADPETTADDLINNYGANIAAASSGADDASRDEIIAAIKKLQDEGLA